MQKTVWVEMLNIVIRVMFIEKVTFKEKSEVGKRMPCRFLRKGHSRMREQSDIGHKVSMCLEFSRNSKDGS